MLYNIIGFVLVFITLIIGLVLKFLPPKNINFWYGYRTNISMKNQENWDYAHKICANIFLIYSAFSIPAFIISFIIGKIYFENNLNYISIISSVILLLIGITSTIIITQIKTINFEKQQNK